MKQFEKWKPKFAEAENGWELMRVYTEMQNSRCRERNDDCYEDSCHNCLARWLDSEVKKDDKL